MEKPWRRWSIVLTVIGLFATGSAVLIGCGEDDPGDQNQVEDPTAKDLSFTTQPPSEVEVGEAFEVAIQIVDDDAEPVDADEADVTVTVSDGEFADGTDEATAGSDGAGFAKFELTIDTPFEGLELVATSDHEDLDGVSTTSDNFDVVPADPAADTSWIDGEDATADGQDTADITIELFDEFNNPVEGVTPEFEASGDGNDYQPCTETDADGIAHCEMTSTEPGMKTLEITEPVSVVGETIEFLPDCDEQETPFGGGDGSEDDPYLVCDPAHLDSIRDELDGAFLLAADVDMDGVAFDPIGDPQGDPFAGYFDGDERTISNLTMEAGTFTAMFADVNDGGIVESVVLEDVDVTGGMFGNGALVGRVIDDGKVADSSVVGGQVTGENETGGLVGMVGVDGRVENSFADVDVQATEVGNGGLAGTNMGTILDSESAGDVSGGDADTGGLVGWNSDGGEIHQSVATGEVTGDESTGGLVGVSDENTVIADSYAIADAHGQGDEVGGLLGRAHEDAEIQTSYAAGAVSGDAGGLGGLLGGDLDGGTPTVTNSYWDEETTGVTESHGGGEGLDTDEFADTDSFDGWDFDDVWEISDAPDEQTRPVLQWQD